MYSEDEIFARLQNGEKVDAIANEMADVINAALFKYETSLHEAQIQKEKEKAADSVAEALTNYVRTYYPELKNPKFKGSDIDAIVSTSSELVQNIDSITRKIKEEDVDKVLADFLRKMNL